MVFFHCKEMSSGEIRIKTRAHSKRGCYCEEYHDFIITLKTSGEWVRFNPEVKCLLSMLGSYKGQFHYIIYFQISILFSSALSLSLRHSFHPELWWCQHLSLCPAQCWFSCIWCWNTLWNSSHMFALPSVSIFSLSCQLNVQNFQFIEF